MTKTDLADLINAACKRSSVAQDKGAVAEVRGSAICYFDRYPAEMGAGLRRITFAKIIGYLQGEDMRAIRKACGKLPTFA